MLSESVNLPLGITVSLGTFLIVFKYFYCATYIVWAFGSSRRAGAKLFFFGLLGLGLIATEAIRLPLERPYGLTHTSPLLLSVADTMVTAETGSPMDGWLVGQTNRHPAWSLVLALSSGLNPSRLLPLLPWVGAFAMALFSVSTLAALKRLEPSKDEYRLSGAYFAVFFSVLLSSNPIDFQYSQPIYALSIFHIEPHRALALPLMLWSGAIVRSKTRAGQLLGTLAIGLLAYLETTYVLIVAMAVIVGLTASRESIRGRGERLAYLLGGLLLGLPGILRLLNESGGPSPDVSTVGSWSRFTSTWIWPSPVFPLALFAIVWACRRRHPAPRFMLLLLFGTSITAVVTALDTAVIDPGAAHMALRYLLSLFAGYGLYYLLQSLRNRISQREIQWSTSAALLFLVSWTFPFWWQPRTMDPFYRDSLMPVSPRLETLATWVRENTENDSVFLVWKNLGPWIPAMTGRRVVLAEEGEHAALSPDLWTLLNRLTRGDPYLAQTALGSLGVTHIVVLRTDLERIPELELLASRNRVLEPAFSVKNWARVYSLRIQIPEIRAPGPK